MKNQLFILIIFSNSLIFCQKKEKEPKIIFKSQIQPLLDNSKTQEAIPLIRKYFNQNLILGEIWNPKVIFLEAENMFLSEKILANNYDKRAFKEYSNVFADSAVFWYKRMLFDKHMDSLFAKERIIIIDKSKNEFQNILEQKRKREELDEAIRIKNIADSIEREKIIQEKRALFIKDSIKMSLIIALETNEYNNAKTINRIPIYKSFLKNYPESRYFLEIDTLCCNLAIKKADSIHTIAGYKEYLDSFPNTIYQNDIINKMLKLTCPNNISTMSNLTDVNKAISQIRDINNKFHLGFKFDKLYEFSTSEFKSNNWTYKNLNVSHFSNGDTIFQAKTNQEWIKASLDKKPAWCYFENNPDNGIENGKLYNFYAIIDERGLVSNNYAIPSLNVFNELVTDAGGTNQATKNLKCLYTWNEEGEEGYFGFDASPSGYRDENGNFFGKDEECRYWSTTESENEINYLELNKNSTSINLDLKAKKGFGFSIRLISLYEDSEYSYSEIIEELFIKRDELLLKEYGLQKDESSIRKFLFKQIKNELGIKNLKEEEIDQKQFQTILDRFYNNEEIIKNGNFPVPPMFYEFMKCGADGFGGDPNPEILHGYSNNVQNFIKWENGATYSGDLKNGIPSGKGKYVSGKDLESSIGGGDVYEGDFVDGYMYYGTIKFKDKRIYIGQCNTENIPNGQGIITLANGTKFTGEFVDGVYQKGFECKSTTINDKVWMAENLAVSKYRNGEIIPQAKNLAEWYNYTYDEIGCWAYENFDSNLGKIYNKYAVQSKNGLAPKGWHIALKDEIKDLMKFIANKQKKEFHNNPNNNYVDESLNDYGGIASIAVFLRSKCCWNTNTLVPKGLDTYGLNLKPNWSIENKGNERIVCRTIDSEGLIFTMWSFNKGDVYVFNVYGEVEDVIVSNSIDQIEHQVFSIDTFRGHAVRCVKD